MSTSDQDEESPAKFYKYRSMANADTVKWVEKIVCHDEIYFAPAKTFNDPFDLRPIFSLKAPKTRQLKEYERVAKKLDPTLNREGRRAQAREAVTNSLNPKDVKATEEAVQIEHSRVLTEKVGVFCVSAKPDDILMWSHYADFHRGICLEFDGQAKLMAQAHKVQYSQKRVPIKAYSDHRDESMTKALLTKSSQWAYEAEWRLIRYDKGPGAAEFRPENLTGIILGAASSPEIVALVKQWAESRAQPLTIYQASLSRTDYALDIKKRRI